MCAQLCTNLLLLFRQWAALRGRGSEEAEACLLVPASKLFELSDAARERFTHLQRKIEEARDTLAQNKMSEFVDGARVGAVRRCCCRFWRS